MKKNSLFSAMASEFALNYGDTHFSLVGIEKREKTDVKGSAKTGTRCVVEIPRGFGAYSRKRFTVTVWGVVPPVAQDSLDENDFLVGFTDFTITFVDSTGEIYAGASALNIIEN